tara:strand:+ start:1515 stop:1841 length:327 start_codon:yes stop_codon:yes gene_type:complete
MFQKYKWKKRLLISYFKDDKFHSVISKDIIRYFMQNSLEIEERLIKYIAITEHDFIINQIQIFDKDTFGLFLVGLDGTVKMYSKDLTILDSLFDIIDHMPMRKMDMKK